MKEYLHIALIQTSIFWEDIRKNIDFLTEKIAHVKAGTDIIVLPEMFTTGFTMNPSLVAETMQGSTVHWMQTQAQQLQIAIMGSIVIQENGKFYNRLLFVKPTGEIDYYDKRHTFTLAGEDKQYAKGNKKIIIEYLGWKICPLICYDLRFPVWARNTEEYHVIMYVANWPSDRIKAWDVLLKARAIENMSYCLGVNRIGMDNNLIYPGHSTVYNVLGDTIVFSAKEETVYASLYREEIHSYRNKLKFLEDRDTFILKE